jgi:hypothetical protein
MPEMGRLRKNATTEIVVQKKWPNFKDIQDNVDRVDTVESS